MTSAAPDFDVEKRRRWYAVVMGLSNATITMTILFLQNGIDEYATLLVYFGFWLLISVLTFVSAYVLWWREYNSKIKAVLYSCLSVTLFSVALSSLNFFFFGSYSFYGLKGIVEVFIRIHIDLFGIPYMGAIIVGWICARPAPDVRAHF